MPAAAIAELQRRSSRLCTTAWAMLRRTLSPPSLGGGGGRQLTNSRWIHPWTKQNVYCAISSLPKKKSRLGEGSVLAEAELIKVWKWIPLLITVTLNGGWDLMVFNLIFYRFVIHLWIFINFSTIWSFRTTAVQTETFNWDRAIKIVLSLLFPSYFYFILSVKMARASSIQDKNFL
jgi:hypothetical protein